MSGKQSRKTFRQRLDEMVRTLREQILTGHYAVGDFLPSEMDLGAAFQLSNNSVRKGLETLVSEGLIEKIPRVGNRIKAPDTEAQTVLRLGYHSTLTHQAELSDLLSEFERKHPHLRVETIKIDDSREYVKNLISTGLIDVLTVNESLFSGLGDQLEPQEPNEHIHSFLQDIFRRNGTLYAQPFIYSPVILCYNRDHFMKMQVPEPDSSWTWDDLMKCASQLAVRNERFGLYFPLFHPNRWVIFLLQSGETFKKDKTGRYRLEGTGLFDGVEKVREILYNTDVYPLLLSASRHDAERMFREEQVSIIMTTYLALNELKDAKFDFDVAPLPYLYDARTLLITIGLAINKHSKVKTAAKQLVQFLISDEAQLYIRRKTYSLTSHMQTVQYTGEEELPRPSRFQMYREIIPSFRQSTDTNLTFDQLDKVLSECKLYWAGLRSKEALIKNVEMRLNQQHSGEPPEDANVQ